MGGMDSAPNDNEGGEDMPTKKRLRARVAVGCDAEGNPVYKWASGYTKRELKASKERLIQEYGQAAQKREKALPESTAPAPKGQSVTFRQYAETWYKLFKEPHLRASSREMYENTMRVHLFPTFGEKPIASISLNELQGYIIEYEEASASMIDKIMLVLRQVFAAALDDEIILRNPVPKMRPPKGRKGDRKPLTIEEVQAVTEAALRLPDGLFPLLLLYTGLRRGEALALSWDDVDGEYIHVRHSVTYERGNKPILGDTKTDAGRRNIPIMPVLAQRLAQGGQGFIFGGERIMPYTSFKRMWARLQGQIDALKGVSPHRLRHTYLMLLRRADVDPVTQQYLMGHTDFETTADIYTTVDDADVRDARAKLATNLPALLPVLLPHGH